MLFAGNKLHSQVVAGNLSVSILGQVEFCMETFLWYAKFAAATLLRGQVVSNVSWLMFLDPPEYSPVPLEYCQTCGQFVVCRNQEGSLLLLVVENLQPDGLLLTERVQPAH